MTDSKPAGGSATEERVPPDPIYQKSYSLQIALASIALVGSIAYAIADEAFLRRPYKGYQRQYKAATLAYLDRLSGEKLTYEGALRALDEFKALDAAVLQATRDSNAARLEAQTEFDRLQARSTALIEKLKVANSEIAALTYDAGHATHEAMEADGGRGEHDPAKAAAGKPALDAIARIRDRTEDYTWRKPTITCEETTNDSGVAVFVDTVTHEAVSESARVGALIDLSNQLQDLKGRAQVALGRALAPKAAAEKARSEWLSKNVRSLKTFLDNADDATKSRIGAKVGEVGVRRYLDDYAAPVSSSVVAGVRAKLAEMPTDPFFGGDIQGRQIHIPKSNNWIDRCEVCHLGARSDVPVTEDQLREAVDAAGIPADTVKREDLALFASHPRSRELFAKHDPARLGCSTCHNGNGIAIQKTRLAHGENEDWLWPLFPKENIEAGCMQCHRSDVHLESGPGFNSARDTFMHKGCWGCHPYEGYDRQSAEIKATDGHVADLTRAIDAKRERQDDVRALANAVPEGAASDAQFAAARAEGERLTEEIAQIQTEIDLEHRHLAALWNEREKVGPNLKEVRIGMRPEVLTPWIQDPTTVRKRTKMPVFRWWGAKDADGISEDAKNAANFLWWSSYDPEKFPEARLPKVTGGSGGRGKELFEKSGCLSCHGIEKDGVLVGNEFAADLSNVGEKKTIEWIYRWVKAPRHRLIAYSTKLQRDVTKAEADAADPETLVWRMPSRMPDFRLTDDEARDVATYLAGLTTGRTWPKPVWLEKDDARFQAGLVVVRNAGCAGCHEIAGLENERGIGTDLTKEGTKPLDRLDFGHYTIAAKRGHEPIPDWETADGVKVFAPQEGGHEEHEWYRPRGYFMHKLAQPDLFDTAKYFPDPSLRARMPKFRLTARELTDLTTFLLGSVESRLPESSVYRPDERQTAIQDGWWVVKRYNCEGCHPVVPGQKPAFQGLPWWPADVKPDQFFPPTLVGAGFRLRPDFLVDFLHDPSLGGGTAKPRSVRRHLDVRMPSFHLTEDEVAKLVRYFEAMAGQPAVYQPPVLAPVSAKEDAAATAIWKTMNCMQCHVAGDTPINNETKAPDILLAKRRLRPEWMARWIPNPAEMQPKTAMTKNFNRERADDPKSRWIYMDKLPELEGIPGDHVDLMIRWLYRLQSAPK